MRTKQRKKASLKDAFQLFLEGSRELAIVENNGIKIDTGYLDSAIVDVSKQMQDIDRKLIEDKEVWPTWKKRFGGKANLGSVEQFGKILFDELGYKCSKYTPTGRAKVDESVIEEIPLQFAKDFLRLRKLEKLRNTYLTGIKRETVDGYLHPVFNLHIVDSYRSSSSDPNFQNMPNRNPEMMKIIRRCIIPRKGRHLVEIDFSGIEVRISACYNKDPTLIKYIEDASTDMHRDQACELFMIPEKWVDKKTTRDCAKNQWVFPQFYGSVYFQCAPAIWKSIVRRNFTLPNGKTVKEHLAEKGIRKLGACTPKEKPVRGTFEWHLKECEYKLWNERFPVYTRWKNSTYSNYLNTGYFDMLTGFRCTGWFRRNQVINYPVQGAAFHCLLWSLIQINKWLRKHKMKSIVIGQIHDCIVLDVHPSELQDVLTTCHLIMTKLLLQNWPWINVPLETESEVCPIDADWTTKKVWTKNQNVWSLKV